ncbi:Replication-associated recombination protein A [Eubacteriaceae bacterium CHKCI005]|nr:Replication-associated recombination protein A [Eubacteriaceae bacterium CHKCI005]
MSAPLADRMRPRILDDVVGQTHMLAPGKALRNIIQSGNIPNMIFYGPPGVGKTTVASIIAQQTHRRLHKLNGTTASTADIKAVVGELDTLAAPGGVLLYLDEIQYFNKRQQQTLLEHIENGSITLIASTTENPYFYVYGAILSRCTVFEFHPVEPEEVKKAVTRAFHFLEEERKETIRLDGDIAHQIAVACGGDVRKSINAVELCAMAAPVEDGVRTVTSEQVEQLAQRSSMRYDRDGDQHYDILSAFQKSMRGSDPDAALHYLARLLEAGDLQSACRRLMVCACEDMGLAYPIGIAVVKACVDAAFQVGLPEAVIPLSDAVVLVATAPKSNSAYMGYLAAAEDIRAGKTGDVPAYLKDCHYQGAKKMGRGLTYQYPHNFARHWVDQQYLPDRLKDVSYYQFGDNKNEQAAKAYWDAIKGSTQGRTNKE